MIFYANDGIANDMYREWPQVWFAVVEEQVGGRWGYVRYISCYTIYYGNVADNATVLTFIQWITRIMHSMNEKKPVTFHVGHWRQNTCTEAARLSVASQIGTTANMSQSWNTISLLHSLWWPLCMGHVGWRENEIIKPVEWAIASDREYSNGASQR